MSTSSLSIARPDDWHVHLRDAPMLATLVRATAAHFARAVVMPNLQPPLTDARAAAAYRNRIVAVRPIDAAFRPLMTCYLTDHTDRRDLLAGFHDGVFTAAKLYPVGATTHSQAGVTDVGRIGGVLDAMQQARMPLLVHGEVVDSEVDIFDREAVFIERVLEPLRRTHPELRIVLEHITTQDAVDYVKAADATHLAATITPHHLSINRNAMFDGGLRPHMYCLPVAKRERHRQALRVAATSGDRHFFIGTDSAPHPVHSKEAACGCAGVFNAPTALATYAQVFEEENALDKLDAFAARFGPTFYGLEVNAGSCTLEARAPLDMPQMLSTAAGEIVIFTPPGGLRWRVAQVST